MRDILVTLMILLSLGYTFKRPHIGILLWSWLSYMNPHRMCWGFAYSMPFAQVTAIVCIGAFMLSKEPKQLPRDPLVLLVLIFILWIGITTFFAFRPESSSEKYTQILKIYLPIFITLMMFNTRERIEQLLWIIFISIGYFGIKGGIFTVATGGGFHVYGPPASFIEENNALAVALLMIMPLAVYLRQTLSKPWQQHIMLACIISMGFSVLGSQSRGAFLAVLAVGIYFWMQSKSKVFSGFLIIIFAAIAINFLPESWYSRMNTIETYDTDASAMGRIRAWELALKVANHNLFGGGLNFWGAEYYAQYIEGYTTSMGAFVAHSIYFSVLGEHGWIGFFLFMCILCSCWVYCNQILKRCINNPKLDWASHLAKMIKVTLIAYCIGGSFLSLSYFDLPWHILAIIVLLKQMVKDQNNQLSESEFKKTEITSKKGMNLDAQGYIR